MNNINLHPLLHRFQIIADYWANFCFRQGVVPRTHSFAVNSNARLRHFLHGIRHTLLGVKSISIFWTVWAWITSVINGRTDRQICRQTEWPLDQGPDF